MKSAIDILEERVSLAIQKVTGMADRPGLVKPATDTKFGDYQANGVMALAKQLKENPRQLAEKIVAQLDISDICHPAEIAGPGFINLRLKNEFLSDALMRIYKDCDGRFAIEKTASPETVVVDFSGPNIAKQMHVGHLRSTIIGDCICRMLEFQGHTVIRQNHIGDWGTQFGMLIQYLRQQTEDIEAFHVSDLENFYKEAKKQFDLDANFQTQARQRVVELHNHKAETIGIWKHIVDESRSHYQPIYKSLGVTLTKEDERGESQYNDMLPGVVEELKAANLAKESDGAVCVFPDGFKNKENQPLPFIIQKSDGAYLYATTDLAALGYRINQLKADRIVYVTDSRQKLHFQMLFATGKAAGWVDDKIKLEHVMFGSVLGEDGKPLKTRSGESVKLKDLLDEAVSRAKAVVQQKNPDISEAEKDNIARAVGIGAVKYADFSNNRLSDYLFSFDKMLAMEGNTAPYMQYACARIKSIERKAEEKGVDIEAELSSIEKLNITDAAELDLAKHLILYGKVIESAAAECRPNYLTTYLYDLAGKFSTFYNACPVLIAESANRPTRILLCRLTEKTIAHGLTELLGIDVVEKM
jgi:arginyl-tRNA synthetase